MNKTQSQPNPKSIIYKGKIINYNNLMKEITNKWYLFAKADLDGAKRLFASPKPTNWTYLLIIWHCHQAIEKALKMIIVDKNKELLKIHDLLKLQEMAEINIDETKLNFIKQLNHFYFKPRYPDLIYKPLPKINKQQTADFLKQTNSLFLWLKKQVN